MLLSKEFLFLLQWAFQQGRTWTPRVHPKELNSPVLENVSEANDGSIPPTTTTNHKQATTGKEEFASPPALEKRQVTSSHQSEDKSRRID
jgi:hypothetical protein